KTKRSSPAAICREEKPSPATSPSAAQYREVPRSCAAEPGRDTKSTSQECWAVQPWGSRRRRAKQKSGTSTPSHVWSSDASFAKNCTQPQRWISATASRSTSTASAWPQTCPPILSSRLASPEHRRNRRCTEEKNTSYCSASATARESPP